MTGELPLVCALIVVALPLVAAPAAFGGGRHPAVGTFGLVVVLVVTAGAIVLLQAQTSPGWQHALGDWPPPLGLRWRLDGASLLMVAGSASVAALVALSARAEPSAIADDPRFWPLLLFLLGALNALFLSGDVFNLYVTLELVSLAGVALVVLAQTAAALAAAMRYLLAALAGSLCYLLGVSLLYATYGTLDIVLLGERLEPGPPVLLAAALMSVGLLIKTALFPLHGWLPPAHASAPAAASALLSALVVMASLYVLLRLWVELFLPVVPAVLPFVLAIFGAAGVLWASVQALRQRRLKLLIAYSTVAQLGYLLLLLPMLGGPGGAAAWAGGIWLLLSHAFAKAAVFLAAGLILHARGRDELSDVVGAARQLPMTVAALGLAGFTLMGLPPSGGFIAKWLLLQASLESGQWWWMAVLLAGGFLAAGYVFAILNHAFRAAAGHQPFKAVPLPQQVLCLCTALVSVFMGLGATPAIELLSMDFSVRGAP